VNDEQAKKYGFTHKGYFIGIPAYLTDSDCPDVAGDDWFCDLVINIIAPLMILAGAELKMVIIKSLQESNDE